MRILLDSDVIVDILRGFRDTIEKVERLFEGNELYISGITEMEVFTGRDMEDEQKKKVVIKLLSKFKKVNPSNEIFRLAGELRRRYKVPIPDCLVAATNLSIGAELFTKNVKDFGKIKEMKIFHSEDISP